MKITTDLNRVRACRSREDFAALKENSSARPHMEAVAALAELDPILGEVVDSISINE